MIVVWFRAMNCERNSTIALFLLEKPLIQEECPIGAKESPGRWRLDLLFTVGTLTILGNTLPKDILKQKHYSTK